MRTLSSIYASAFYKISERLKAMKISIIGLCQGPKYASGVVFGHTVENKLLIFEYEFCNFTFLLPSSYPYQ